MNMNKQISIQDVDGEDTTDAILSPKENTHLKKDMSPALEAIDENENMKDYHVDNPVIHGDENNSDKENSTTKDRDTIEIMNMSKQISIQDVDGTETTDTISSPQETSHLKKDVSPALEAIDENENMKDYHVDNTCTESVEDSLSNKNNRDQHQSKGASMRSGDRGYHHSPVPHDDHHDHHDISHHGVAALSLHPNQHSFTLTHSEVP
eukprot:CAMPEP_0201592730 /NCGR_PEP_ID=MMETSP0190_2-20130828/190545_1 /ASSEMBLY_ACC=CAM_ASM_000263 /TAXON_ID=37353 /ORGANISM="Rosalina sp." /LENGTH=207 /DNA_ID=CAMNT_0048051637 /DNA_START=786 /DNA_END=1410 /DNA_ORIENTATION=+